MELAGNALSKCQIVALRFSRCDLGALFRASGGSGIRGIGQKGLYEYGGLVWDFCGRSGIGGVDRSKSSSGGMRGPIGG